jgi:hypothetical protein
MSISLLLFAEASNVDITGDEPAAEGDVGKEFVEVDPRGRRRQE